MQLDRPHRAGRLAQDRRRNTTPRFCNCTLRRAACTVCTRAWYIVDPDYNIKCAIVPSTAHDSPASTTPAAVRDHGTMGAKGDMQQQGSAGRHLPSY